MTSTKTFGYFFFLQLFLMPYWLRHNVWMLITLALAQQNYCVWVAKSVRCRNKCNLGVWTMPNFTVITLQVLVLQSYKKITLSLCVLQSAVFKKNNIIKNMLSVSLTCSSLIKSHSLAMGECFKTNLTAMDSNIVARCQTNPTVRPSRVGAVVQVQQMARNVQSWSFPADMEKDQWWSGSLHSSRHNPLFISTAHVDTHSIQLPTCQMRFLPHPTLMK